MFAAVTLFWWRPWLTEKMVLLPSDGGKRIELPQLIANFYPAAVPSQGQVLVIGGSDGGISATADNMAQALATHGFDTMAVSYWGGPGQALEMKELPLENFGTAIDYLKQRGGKDAKIALVGYSKGAEAALLVGGLRQDVAAVVAGAPSSFSWQSMDFAGFLTGGTSTFSWRGEALPFLPYSGVNFFAGPTVLEIHSNSLRSAAGHSDAQIAIDKVAAPTLLLCGGRDLIWPSCAMASELEQRARSRGAPTLRILRYPDAGHGVLGPPLGQGLREDPLITRMTRTPTQDQAARESAWPQVVTFLKSALADEAQAADK